MYLRVVSWNLFASDQTRSSIMRGQSSEYGEAMSYRTSSRGTFRSMDSTQLPGDAVIFSLPFGHTLGCLLVVFFFSPSTARSPPSLTSAIFFFLQSNGFGRES